MSRFLAPADLDSTVLTSISRRLMLGSTCILGLAGCSRGRPDDDPVEAPTTRQVTTPLGTYDIPIRPQRVVTIDSRLDLEPAIALQLPVIPTSYAAPEPWVPGRLHPALAHEPRPTHRVARAGRHRDRTRIGP